MDGQEHTNSWSWRGSIAGAVRNGRTAFLAGHGLALVIVLGGPGEKFALYGRLLADADVGEATGRLLFLGMGCVQIALLALVVASGSLVLRVATQACRLALTHAARLRARGVAHG